MEPSHSIGQRIKRVRGELSQKAFGLKIGLSQTAVTALENDQSEPRLGTFNAIVEAFHVNPEWLRTGAGEMKGEPAYRSDLRGIATQVAANAAVLATPATERKAVPTMGVLREVEDMTPEGQLAYWKLRAELAERKIAAFEEEERHEQTVRLMSSSGGRSFLDASAEAADDDSEPTFMVAVTNPDYVEEPQPLRRRIGYALRNVAELV
jgi:transcriptional regulator with XRE-family HTH domain